LVLAAAAALVFVFEGAWLPLLILFPAVALAALLMLGGYPAEERLAARLRASPKPRAGLLGVGAPRPRHAPPVRRTGLRLAYPLAMRPPPARFTGLRAAG